MGAQITLVQKNGRSARLSKRIYIGEDGKPKGDGSQCVMAEGVATRKSAETATALADIIKNCGANQAIVLGAMNGGLPSPSPITVKKKLTNHPGAISRSRDFIDYRPGTSGWALIDFDTKGIPAHVMTAIRALGGMWSALLTVAPGLQRASRVSRASTSAGIYHTGTGERFSGSGGAHHFVLVMDASDIERFLRDLHDRCWLLGLGWHVIGATGQLLERSLVDRMVAYGERLVFEGAPLLEPPLAQDPSNRIPEVFEGEAIDTTLVLPKPTEYERQRINEAKRISAEALGKAASEIRERADRTLAEKLSAKSGMPPVSALRLVKTRHHGVLLPHSELDFDDLGIVPVSELLVDPERFVGETLADPLEGAGYGRCKAMVMRADEGGLFIHSFAHGRTFYRIRHDLRSAKAALEKAPTEGLVDYAMTILAMSEMEPDEVSDFSDTIAKAAKIGKRAINARISKERRAQEQARRKSATAPDPDSRPVRPRPEPDGELTPVVTYLDEMLAADQSEEPPMRDASGNLVEVRVVEPWDLHLLSADGTNSQIDEYEVMKAPAAPALVQLTPICIELLLEKYVRWQVVKFDYSYYGALQRPFIDALMQISPSALPVARAINTAPLVSMSGNIIAGIGLDRETGLIHRIDPLLRACLPSAPPTDEDVSAAMNFLCDEWLVDVAVDRVGKSIAIMLALTLIERPLLPERPAFFIAAGQRGGGKTTLISMITLAVHGRKAAAAGWSENAEERKKALFSYLRQGVASLVWDNIPRGATISCPHIEAALTASEISDRVLGVSRFETVSSTTVHIFTGNSILPRGDMASRSLMLALNVERPDPENRTFVHADPSGWTEANRVKIMRALYTILIAGAQNRPQTQVAKTRFKTWWNLVGWAVEYSANLVGTKVDCTELLLAGEVGDEEASGASVVLNIFRDIWGKRTFTARDVVHAMTYERSYMVIDLTKPNLEKIRADAITDALGELIGKRFEHPTAHSIGKLFQKRLIGRPAWIMDGQMIATLKKCVGHNENTYRVEVSVPGSSTDTPSNDVSSAAEASTKDSPLSPQYPVSTSDDSKTGKEGKEGKASIRGRRRFRFRTDGDVD